MPVYTQRRAGIPIIDALTDAKINWFVEDGGRDIPPGMVRLGMDVSVVGTDLQSMSGAIVKQFKQFIAFMESVQEVADDG